MVALSGGEALIGSAIMGAIMGAASSLIEVGRLQVRRCKSGNAPATAPTCSAWRSTTNGSTDGGGAVTGATGAGGGGGASSWASARKGATCKSMRMSWRAYEAVVPSERRCEAQRSSRAYASMCEHVVGEVARWACAQTPSRADKMGAVSGTSVADVRMDGWRSAVSGTAVVSAERSAELSA